MNLKIFRNRQLPFGRFILIFLGFGIALGSVLTWISPPIWAAENCENIVCNKDSEEYLDCNRRKQSCWEEKIKETQSSAITLTNTIGLLNGQIRVQELQIDQSIAEISQLEKQIRDLSDRITGLNISLDKLTTVLVQRIGEQYKRSRTNPLLLLVSGDSLASFMSGYKYIQLTRQQTVEAMQRAETQRITYDEQKVLKETKQTELEKKQKVLEGQQTQLTKQKNEQQFLLQETKNNEARYQRELAKTLAELEAIQSIIAGKGNDSKVGDIKQGDKIASVIAGASPCSTGSHLHFEVVKDGSHRDPAGYLKPISADWNNTPDGSFGWGGSWDWPVDNPAKINQGYGMTYYARVRRAYGGAPHTGIDMFSKDSGNYTVKAVKEGVLYRGSIPCGGGLLRYVRVDHKDDGYRTYYLHVNY